MRILLLVYFYGIILVTVIFEDFDAHWAIGLICPDSKGKTESMTTAQHNLMNSACTI